MSKEKFTFKAACELIARSGILVKKDGSNPTAMEIFEYSPTGELWRIWEWFEIVQAVEALKEAEEKGTVSWDELKQELGLGAEEKGE